MNILMTGGTGFIGQKLIDKLIENDHHTYVLTRSPKKHPNTANITFISYDYPVNRLPKIHGVINLAGESIFGKWTDEKKANILKSRLEITEKVIQLISKMNEKPNVFVNASAVGFYGMSDTKIFTEETKLPAKDFLADVVAKWENAALAAEDFGIRTVRTRFGIILDSDNGALSLMDKVFKSFIGGKVGNGEQWMSWVHIDDVINLIYYALTNDFVKGPINVTAPNPLRNKDFTISLGDALNRPTVFMVPKEAITLVMGEMGQLITKGQYVLPKRAIEYGYQFKYPYLKDALEAIYHSK